MSRGDKPTAWDYGYLAALLLVMLFLGYILYSFVEWCL